MTGDDLVYGIEFEDLPKMIPTNKTRQARIPTRPVESLEGKDGESYHSLKTSQLSPSSVIQRCQFMRDCDDVEAVRCFSLPPAPCVRGLCLSGKVLATRTRFTNLTGSSVQPRPIKYVALGYSPAVRPTTG
jgi:hypothetical protein